MAKQYFGLDLTEVVKLANKMKSMGNEDLKSIMQPTVMEGAKTILRDVKRLTPVGTGRLKRNIFVDKLDIRKHGRYGSCIYIRGTNEAGTNSDTKMKTNDPNNAYYWRFVEFGTIRQRPQPFIRTAFYLNKNRVGNAIMRDVYNRVSKKWQEKT